MPKLVDAIRKHEGQPALPYYLIGHSAGGQFLMRVSGFVPTGVRRVVAANPGSDLFPELDRPFPYGFGGLPEELSDDAALKRFLAQPLTLYLGTADLGNENLPQSENANKQGAMRYERGKNCFRAAQELAKAKGWPFNWRLVEVARYRPRRQGHVRPSELRGRRSSARNASRPNRPAPAHFLKAPARLAGRGLGACRAHCVLSASALVSAATSC